MPEGDGELPEVAPATFGGRVTAGREALGMTQQELARRLGVRPETLRAWEGDRAEPRANRLQMLSGLLGISMRWLLTGEGAGPAGPAGPETVQAVLSELRGVRVDLEQAGERIAALERRLRDMPA
ncbi:helix-turn-helix domain-containing protein [Roseitranquillus sediminis]|uniref:helix-turn-helix domain-containing protein n=1 Tax=Roseitranquillus sediminis TaxID=2809051 RepID=UPI001D0C694C|nr:helix-turn-helix domain-containing protein [Roseitranquillus sediminis]MBM9595744.1 helix-turn-helix domain-containing protein [Roseitranquillus sediminis]